MDSAAIHFSTVFMAFFTIMNPIANAPLFLGLTEGLDARTRRGVALHAVLLAFAIVALFTLFGREIFAACEYGRKPLRRKVATRDEKAVPTQVAWAKQRLGLAAAAPVVSCYEAGRDGFWLHRFLTAHGAENLVGDSASIEVNWRKRRAKSDRVDLVALLDLLARHRAGGAKPVWSVVHVPSEEDEDRRHLGRSGVASRSFHSASTLGRRL